MELGVVDNLRETMSGVAGGVGAAAGFVAAGRGAPPQAAAPGAARAVDLNDDDAFARHLERARENVTTLAEVFVANSLIMPLLKQARNDPFKSDLFHGGFTEDAFGGQLDMRMAQRLASAEHMPLSKTFAEHFFNWIKDDPKQVMKTSRMRMDLVG